MHLGSFTTWPRTSSQQSQKAEAIINSIRFHVLSTSANLTSILKIPLSRTLPVHSNELKTNKRKQQLIPWSGCLVLQVLQKIREKGHEFSVFSQQVTL